MAHKSILDLYEASDVSKYPINNQSDDRTPISQGVGNFGDDNPDNNINSQFKHIGPDGSVVKTSSVFLGRGGDLGNHGNLAGKVSSWTPEKRYNRSNADIMRNIKK